MFSPVADPLHEGFANKLVFTHPVAMSSDNNNGEILLFPFMVSVGPQDEGTLFISVAVASIRSCAKAFMMAVAICLVNLGICQWRHLLCKCVIIVLTATVLCRIICSREVMPYFKPPKRNKYGESVTVDRSGCVTSLYLN